MRSFLKYTLATIVGVIISSFILFLILMGIIGAIVSSTEKQVVVKNNSILHIRLDKTIPERSSDNPFENFDFTTFKPSVSLGLTDMVRNIREAKDDSNIKGIYLDLGMVPMGFGTLEELRNAILDFKKSGKFVISYAEYYSQGNYYLASVADSIFINPAGGITFMGLSSEVMFYKGALDKLGIEPVVIRHGKFKSAVEPYITDKMSPENREQVSTLLNSLWGHVLKGISAQRKIDVSHLNHIADNASVTNAKGALENKFVDGIRYKDEILERLAKLSSATSAKNLEFVTLADYNKAAKGKKDFSKKKIALVYAEGEIVTGEGGSEIASDDLSKAIREARGDSSIKAIVLRINSPGGSALASDIIWREVYLASKTKPLIVSMGNVAASGGYYIAAPANTIVAEPTTITGSIGVFGILFNAQGFLNNKLGITTDNVRTNKHGDIETLYKPLTPEEKAIVQAEVENIYDTFISHVAEGRRLNKAFVDSIGQGRVWSASDAKRLGLVDMIGNLHNAIEIAARKAKLSEYRIVELPKRDDALTSLLSGLSARVRQDAIQKELGEASRLYYSIKDITGRRGILARLPYDLNMN
ncbi:MAG TPA: signal peptide peptidase SppA [Bacteroidales bacterium]|nr:signal peptide peptidase SppA [Bacteroidales bacterium]